MSDELKHECGIALIRLLKPLSYYQEKYGSWQYGVQKLYLLMEKQHNRGQDGAGVASIKLDLPPGKRYIDRIRSNSGSPIKDVFDHISGGITKYATEPEKWNDPDFALNNIPFAANLYLGHLRYGTFGNHSIEYVHPVTRENNWKTRTLVLAGNFNMTNVKELFDKLLELGQHPLDVSDTVTVLEKLGHYIDDENQLLFRQYKNEGISNAKISELISENISIQKVLQGATKDFDGGYALAGLFGHGDAFVARDPWGIRPAFYYHDDEIVVVASERPVIQTVLNVSIDKVHEIKPGCALIVRRNGTVSHTEIRVPQERKSCSFERIYFSRGTDSDIYKERKKLGELLTPAILEAINNELDDTVFSFIPNTAETGFLGLREGLWDRCRERQFELIKKLKPDDDKGLRRVLSMAVRSEKIAVKDAKLRTFIADSLNRHALIGHVYDTTGGVVRPGVDNLVVLDDSIVRGATLRDSILRMLDRLRPRRVVVVSTAPPICYPDCYGIDMASLGEFVAFEAAVRLLRRRDRAELLNEVFSEAQQQLLLPDIQQVNAVKKIYAPLTQNDLADEIAQILRPPDMHSDLKVIYQTLEALSRCCPKNPGNWYFSGDYPTPGGNRVVNQAFVNYMTGVTGRAY